MKRRNRNVGRKPWKNTAAAAWEAAFVATPKLYRAPNGKIFGALALTETVTTVFPKNPPKQVDGIDAVGVRWLLHLVSLSDFTICPVDYEKAAGQLRPYVVGERTHGDREEILIRGLSPAEMRGIAENCGTLDLWELGGGTAGSH